MLFFLYVGQKLWEVKTTLEMVQDSGSDVISCVCIGRIYETDTHSCLEVTTGYTHACRSWGCLLLKNLASIRCASQSNPKNYCSNSFKFEYGDCIVGYLQPLWRFRSKSWWRSTCWCNLADSHIRTKSDITSGTLDSKHPLFCHMMSREDFCPYCRH